MDNLMGEHMEEAFRVYDLKGSTFQRINHNPSKDTSVRKDLNFLDDRTFRMNVNEKLQKDILVRMERDKEFLKTSDLMDYSLLLIFFKRGGAMSNRLGSSNLSFSKKVSVVMREESDGGGKVVTFEEIKEDNKNMNIFGIAPAINSVPESQENTDKQP
jgi:hypothetical protein